MVHLFFVIAYALLCEIFNAKVFFGQNFKFVCMTVEKVRSLAANYDINKNHANDPPLNAYNLE
jgi:hypothetical protein